VTLTRWDPPSPVVAELIRTGCSVLLQAPDEVFEEVDAVVLAASEQSVADDPAFAAMIRRNNRANLVHWATANVRDPGAPVPPHLTAETLAVARDVVRRGFDDRALHAYRVGQNIAWQRWMAMCFEMTADPPVLRELLDVTARSIFSFVDETLEGIARQIELERDELTRGTHAQRMEVVSLLLEGAPIGAARASARLGYDVARTHTAAIVWTEGAEPDPARLEQAAEAVGRAAGGRPLTVLASASSLWVWVVGEVGPLVAPDDVRIALGPLAAGVDGFRRSHLDALATQRLMHRAGPHLRLARYDEVQVVALATADEERATEFVARTLGDLAAAPAELRETLRVYLREGQSATRAARVLFTHRNTVLGRLSRIEDLLPAPLEGRALPVALALEILHWQ
jgi:DNA-binding PucR family transcriptional regulator